MSSYIFNGSIGFSFGSKSEISLIKLLNNLSDDDKEIAKVADYLTADALANITHGWRGFVDKGKKVTFSTKKVSELYRCAPYIREQVDNFFSDRVNFTKGKAKG